MLVLTRRVNEQIRIGDNVLITIVEIRSGGQVRIGIDAPLSFDVSRPEAVKREPPARKECAAC
jgi:carbon storage regulator